MRCHPLTSLIFLNTYTLGRINRTEPTALAWAHQRAEPSYWIHSWVSQPRMFPKEKRNGCASERVVTTSLSESLKASAWRRKMLLLHLAHLAPVLPTCCAFCPHRVSHCTVQMGNRFAFHFYTNIFKMCKNVGTHSKCLPSERDCHCKQGCMHPHISPVCSLLCRWASNTEAFHMLILRAVIPVCFYNMFIHCSLSGGIPRFLYSSQQPNGH